MTLIFLPLGGESMKTQIILRLCCWGWGRGIGPLIDSSSAGTKGAELVVLTGKRTKNLALISSADYESELSL